MNEQKALRDHLRNLLQKEEAHTGFEKAVADFPSELRGKRPDGSPHSPWELLEHLRIAQHDILEFTRDPQHQSPPWPEGYWPKSPTPENDAAWDASVEAYVRDRDALVALLDEDDLDLLEPIKHGDGQTPLRELLLAADHNSYHLGQLLLVRRLLGAWK